MLHLNKLKELTDSLNKTKTDLYAMAMGEMDKLNDDEKQLANEIFNTLEEAVKNTDESKITKATNQLKDLTNVIHSSTK